jgi:hypothetical protein
MAVNMYSFFLPLNIVKYQPSFIEITLRHIPELEAQFNLLNQAMKKEL